MSYKIFRVRSNFAMPLSNGAQTINIAAGEIGTFQRVTSNACQAQVPCPMGTGCSDSTPVQATFGNKKILLCFKFPPSQYTDANMKLALEKHDAGKYPPFIVLPDVRINTKGSSNADGVIGNVQHLDCTKQINCGYCKRVGIPCPKKAESARSTSGADGEENQNQNIMESLTPKQTKINNAMGVGSSIGLLAGLGFAFKGKKGPWAYVGYGLLGIIAGGTLAGVGAQLLIKE